METTGETADVRIPSSFYFRKIAFFDPVRSLRNSTCYVPLHVSLRCGCTQFASHFVIVFFFKNLVKSCLKHCRCCLRMNTLFIFQ